MTSQFSAGVRRDGSLRSSFRDPSGFLFEKNGELYRQVTTKYEKQYERLSQSGLYDKLTKQKHLISHQEVDKAGSLRADTYRILKPELIPFISYPYEWTFGQLKDAALLTLSIQKQALEHNMILKDATAFNIQFLKGSPIHIDTLSFELYKEGAPWIAYRQFCEHFLAPLALMSRRDIRLSHLLVAYLDGVPLDLASKLLPKTTYLTPGLVVHIHIHAKLQLAYNTKPIKSSQTRMSKEAMISLVNSLEKIVHKLSWQQPVTQWGNYYNKTNYKQGSLQKKGEIVEQFLSKITPSPKTAWDLGSNNGFFSRLASKQGIYTVASDIDPVAAKKNYIQLKKYKEENILPLVIDITNPTSALGWGNTERMSLAQRGPADVVLALAFIHHLAITNNLPLAMIAEYMRLIGKHLIIEWVPKSDSNTKRLLAGRDDIFDEYTQKSFEESFSKYFTIIHSESVVNSKRIIYLMRAKVIQSTR